MGGKEKEGKDLIVTVRWAGSGSLDVILQVVMSCCKSFNQVTAAFFYFRKNIQMLYFHTLELWRYRNKQSRIIQFIKCCLLLGCECLVLASSRSPFLLTYAKNTHMLACGCTYVSRGGDGGWGWYPWTPTSQEHMPTHLTSSVSTRLSQLAFLHNINP